MNSDKIYMIPNLSQELNLIGYRRLPYEFVGRERTEVKASLCKNAVDFSDSDSEESVETEISFDANEMIASLVSTCFDLVKEVKTANNNEASNSDEYDRVKFENNSLKKHISLLKKELEQKTRSHTNCMENCRQLKVKTGEMEGKIKKLEKEKLKLIQQSQSTENVLRQKNKEIENDLLQMHRHINSMPQNFGLLSLKETKIKKLWSEVKYASKLNREETLKAILAFEENDEYLVENNRKLKTLLFVTVEEINSLIELLSNKFKLGCKKIDKSHLQEIFIKEKGLAVAAYKKCIQDHLKIFINVFDSFDECSFPVNNHLFVCLDDVEKKTNFLLDT